MVKYQASSEILTRRCVSPHPLHSNNVVRIQIKRNSHFRGEVGRVADVMLTGQYYLMASVLSFIACRRLSCATFSY